VGGGNNGYGQLGDGTFNSTTQPEEIISSGVTAIAAGGLHSLFLKSDGSLWAMVGFFWQLGDGSTGSGITNQPAGRDRYQRRHGHCGGRGHSCFSNPTAACGRWGTIIMASWAMAHSTIPTGRKKSLPAVSRHCGGRFSQPVSQIRRQPMGDGQQFFRPAWRRHIQHTNQPEEIVAVASRLLRQDMLIACFSNPMAACGLW